METYRITCKETVYFVKEVEANSEDEAKEKLHVLDSIFFWSQKVFIQ